MDAILRLRISLKRLRDTLLRDTPVCFLLFTCLQKWRYMSQGLDKQERNYCLSVTLVKEGNLQDKAH